MKTTKLVQSAQPTKPLTSPIKFVVGGEYEGRVASVRGHFYIFVDFGAPKKGLLKGVSGLLVGDKVLVKITDMEFDPHIQAMSYSLTFVKILERITDQAVKGKGK